VDPLGRFNKAFNDMPDAFKLPWRVFVEAHAGDKGKQGKSGKWIKYTCPVCGTNIWGKEGLNITCNDCGAAFQEGLSSLKGEALLTD